MTTGRINQVTTVEGGPRTKRGPPAFAHRPEPGERRCGRKGDRRRTPGQRERRPALKRTSDTAGRPFSATGDPVGRHPRTIARATCHAQHRPHQACLPQEEVTRRRSRRLGRLPVRGHAPDCVLGNDSQRPTTHRLPQCQILVRAPGLQAPRPLESLWQS